ncbi:hypothetical protein D3C76_1079510 [compost metagenome]
MYDNISGTITINDVGSYEIDWWVSIESVVDSNNSVFRLAFNDNQSVYTNTPIKTGSTSGTNIITVTTAPVSFQLRNEYDIGIYLSNLVPIKSNLRILELSNIDSSSNCFMYNQYINILEQLVQRYQGQNVRIYISNGQLEGTLDSLFKSPSAYTSGLILIIIGGITYAVNAATMPAIQILGVDYDETITFLDLPDPFVQNCENIQLPTFAGYMGVGDNVTISASIGVAITGNVYVSQPGVTVLTETGSSNPTFVISSSILIMTKNGI